MNKELKPYHVHLICNAKYHDSDFARLEILKLLSEHDDIYTTVSDTYDNFENHIDPQDPTNNCLDVAIITAPEKRTKKTIDKLKTVAGRVLNK